MKCAVTVLILSVLVSCAANARGGLETAVLGLYLDEQRLVGFWPCADTLSLVTVWVWCLPSERGMIGARFAVDYFGVGLTPGAVTPNPAIVQSQGELLSGVEVAFGECHLEWVWTHTQIWVVDHPWNSQISIGRYLHSDEPTVSSCAAGHPPEPCSRGPYITLCFFDGVEETSWGAIKSLYHD